MLAHAVAQPNIALVKYWGKRNVRENLPAAGSISVTLDALWTRMSVEVDARAAADTLSVNGARESGEMLTRVSACLDRMLGTSRPRAAVQSTSNFPIAAGLASSSSAFAALVMAASRAMPKPHDTLSLARLAGAASGSAARSFYEGIVELKPGGEQIELRSISAASEWPLRIIVGVTAEGPKGVGSGEAMIRSAATSPFYRSWVEQQDADLELARQAVRDQDFEKLAAVSEHNCLKMHSVMWTSRPPIVYWNEATLNGMETIRELQRSGIPVFFTIDAGPQVKAICLPDASAAVEAALAATKGVKRTISSGLGRGARELDDLPDSA